MPKRGYLYSVHKFYQNQSLDHVMFGYVLGATKVLPTLNIVKAVEMFLADFNLCEDDYCLETARTRFYRMLNELKDKEEGEIECYEIKPRK